MEKSLDEVRPHPYQKGHHTSGRIARLFIDTCVQIWPDTAFGELCQYSATGYCITTFRPNDDAAGAFDALAQWYGIAQRYDSVRLVYQVSDIVEAFEQQQAAIIINAQGGDFLGRDLARLEAFHRLGLRMMLPAYNYRNALCDGQLEVTNAGLSYLGRRWVEECNRLGIVIDLTHVGERSTLEILERSEQPVVFSHSNPKGLVDNLRNITDEQIRLCAETGGVIGVTNWGPLNLREGASTRPTLDHYIEALAYVAELVGIDHVGIGTDMSHGTYPDGDHIRGLPSKSKVGGDYARHIEASPRSRLRYVEGFDDYGHLPTVIERLHEHGFSSEDIDKLLGKNWLRVFERVWKV